MRYEDKNANLLPQEVVDEIVKLEIDKASRALFYKILVTDGKEIPEPLRDPRGERVAMAEDLEMTSLTVRDGEVYITGTDTTLGQYIENLKEGFDNLGIKY